MITQLPFMFKLLILLLFSFELLAETIFIDDFQDGNFYGWVSNDTNGSSKIVKNNGSLMFVIRNMDSASISIDTTGVSGVVISLDMMARSLEKGELCLAEAEGITVGQLGKKQANGVVVQKMVVNSVAFDDNPDLTLTLKAAGNHDSDYCYFDNVIVEAIPGSMARFEVTASYLNGETDDVFSTAAFLPQNNNVTVNTFEGRLEIKGTPTFKRLYGWRGNMPAKANQWPKFDVEFIQHGNELIPVDRRGMRPVNADDAWSIAVGTGAVWDEQGDEGMTRAAFPFTLGQRNANCEHNGLATFLFDDTGNISNVHVQTVAETCKFYGFDMYGTLNASYDRHKISKKAQILREWENEVAHFIPTKPLAQLALDYPGVNLRHFHPRIKAADLHMYGIIVNGINYIDGCNTRFGKHPFCSEMTTSLYSITKSTFSSLAVMRAEKLWPGFKNESIASLVPECVSSGNWDDVSIENALDMATGNYVYPWFQYDEHGFIMKKQFFSQKARAQRADFACNRLPRKAIPGSRMVSHTSDHELISYALTQIATDMLGHGADGFIDIVKPVYQEIGLSQAIQGIRRTSEGNAWGGYGMSAKANDIALFSNWLANGEAETSGLVDEQILNDILSGFPRGLYAGLKDFNYDNGFWRYHAGATTTMKACGTDTQIPVMSGYGGHTVVIMPNVIFYQMTDGGGIGFKETISDVFDNIDNTCP